MPKFESLSMEDVVRYDAEGRLSGINPLPVDLLESFQSKDLGQVAKLNQIFDAYTGRDPIDARQATAKWLERFNITTSDPRYQVEFDRLIESGASNKAVLAESRRAGERSELLHAADGNLDVNCVYVNEGENPCEECAAIGGEEMTLAEFEDANMMPGDRCLGGDNCKCVLIPIERR
jgi:hypothetical protein